jgi:predicted outer membrane repeat protein
MGWKMAAGTAVGVAAALAGAVMPAAAATVTSTATAVPCSTPALASAVSRAASGATLSLADGCTYVLTKALPAIAQDLTINGNGATLLRSTAPRTRAFTLMTITAGTVTLNQLSFTNGKGAITVNNQAQLNVTGGVFRGNTAANGGAINTTASIENPSATVVDATGVFFIGNTATGDGGAMYVSTVLGDEITDCTFLGNIAAGSGGALSEWSNGTEIADSTFWGNKAATGGALEFDDQGSEITGTIVNGNRATGDGGGIADEPGGTPVFITDSKITGNHAGGIGGGLDEESNGSYGGMTNTIVSGNSATDGGGINDGENAYAQYTDDTIFANYASGDGGGIALNASSGPPNASSFSGGAISGNLAGARGGGLYTQEPLDLSSTQVVGNWAAGGGGIYDDGTEAPVMLTGSSPAGNEPDNCEPPGSITGCTRLGVAAGDAGVPPGLRERYPAPAA